MSTATAVQTCRAAASLFLVAAIGCTAEPEGGGPDAGGPVGAGPAELGADFQPIAPCLAVEDYAARAVVRFDLSARRFTPRCVRLATGGTVVFQGWMAAHPLQPRDERSAPSPIVNTLAGGSVEFEFPDFGFFPYRCAAHPEETGVVWASYAF